MMDRQPILTIACPTYNGARTIGAMLDVLLPQIDDDVEVIISDNCSTDNTKEIVERYCEQYKYIRLETNDENIGADGNFLKCMNKANGKYLMLISDDDIVCEGAVSKIVCFLKENEDVSLAYVESVAFRDKYINIDKCHGYKFLRAIPQNKVTTDKKEFFTTCSRLWGFTSSYIYSVDRIRKLENVEQYIGTFFLQAYVCILCSNKDDDVLGLIHGPCIAAGEYGIIANIDMAQVEGIYYYDMMRFAIKNGYPKREFLKYYSWKITAQCQRSIIKERAIGVHRTSIKNILRATWKYPRAWLCLYPIMLFPPFFCRWLLKFIRRMQGRGELTSINRI